MRKLRHTVVQSQHHKASAKNDTQIQQPDSWAISLITTLLCIHLPHPRPETRYASCAENGTRSFFLHWQSKPASRAVLVSTSGQTHPSHRPSGPNALVLGLFHACQEQANLLLYCYQRSALTGPKPCQGTQACETRVFCTLSEATGARPSLLQSWMWNSVHNASHVQGWESAVRIPCWVTGKSEANLFNTDKSNQFSLQPSLPLWALFSHWEDKTTKTEYEGRVCYYFWLWRRLNDKMLLKNKWPKF